MAKVISNEALASVTLELSMLLHAGVGVSDALEDRKSTRLNSSH